MKFRLLSLLALAGISLAACGGGGGGSLNSVTPPAPGPVTHQSTARGTMTMRIPLGVHGTRNPGNTAMAVTTNGDRKPLFISQSGNGAFYVFFDKNQMFDATFAPTFDSSGNIVPGAGPTGNGTLANGGTYSYTSQYISTNAGGAVTVTVSYTTIPGPHEIGVVQTNGPCAPDQYGRELCIGNTSGYVLAEGQGKYVLQPGNNAPNALFLSGVVEAAYLCDAACDGQAGNVDNNGNFSITAYASTEAGDAIVQQIDPSTTLPVPFDNGQAFQIVENDNNNVVTITQPGTSYTNPGNSNANGPYGIPFTLTCNKVGTATVAMQLTANSPSQGAVDGFTYSSTDYPQPGTILGAAGADEYFGNQLSVNCTASGSVIIE